MISPQPTATVALKHLAVSIQTGPFGSQLHAEDYSADGRPVVNPAHLTDGRIEPDFDVAVDEETFARLAQHELRAGDVVIGRRGELGRCGVVQGGQEGWLCGTGSIRLRPNRSKLDPRWLRWLLSWSGTRDWLSLASVGTTMENLGAETVGGMPVPVVDSSTQRAIADYLDRETARLDALVAAKERVLALLAEKRRALITRAVTRGLDPRAPLRDSDVPWLGEIPAQWEVWKLGHLAVIGNGSTPSRDNPDYWANGTIAWLTSSVVNQEEVSDADQFVTATAFQDCHLPLVKPGSVLVGITGQGKTRGQATVLSIEAAINQHLAFISPDGTRLDSWFLRWALFAAYEYLRSISDDAGGTKGALTCEEVANLRVALPTMAEQLAIAEHIRKRNSSIDGIRLAAERTIALLKERRAALIAAAVTGQVGLRGVAV